MWKSIAFILVLVSLLLYFSHKLHEENVRVRKEEDIESHKKDIESQKTFIEKQ